MSDRLTLAHAIEDAGIDRAKAERVASAIVDLIHDEVATKADVQAVRNEIGVVRSEFKADIAAIRGDLALVEHLMITSLGGLVVPAVGIILAALRYWPPAGHG
jgi:Uncharacterised conserved protein (DUF2371)